MIDSRPVFVQSQVSLKPYNTFRFDYQAQYFALVETAEQLTDAITWAQAQSLPITTLGGGSNLLLQGDVTGLVLINCCKGIDRLCGVAS